MLAQCFSAYNLWAPWPLDKFVVCPMSLSRPRSGVLDSGSSRTLSGEWSEFELSVRFLVISWLVPSLSRRPCSKSAQLWLSLGSITRQNTTEPDSGKREMLVGSSFCRDEEALLRGACIPRGCGVQIVYRAACGCRAVQHGNWSAPEAQYWLFIMSFSIWRLIIYMIGFIIYYALFC